MNNSEYASKTLDHLGLVAGMCRDIGVADIIDQCCPSESEDQLVSTGKAVEAMILNGLGFVNKRLYLVSRFFEDKPLDRLLGPDITADQLNDDRLGRALDKLYETGLTTIFTQLSPARLAEVCNFGLLFLPSNQFLHGDKTFLHSKINHLHFQHIIIPTQVVPGTAM